MAANAHGLNGWVSLPRDPPKSTIFSPTQPLSWLSGFWQKIPPVAEFCLKIKQKVGKSLLP